MFLLETRQYDVWCFIIIIIITRMDMFPMPWNYTIIPWDEFQLYIHLFTSWGMFCYESRVLAWSRKKGISCFRWWTDLILKMATPPGTHYSTFHFPHSFISIIRCSWRLQLRLCLCQLQLSLLARNVQLCSIAASFSFYCQTKPWSKVKAISSQKIVN